MQKLLNELKETKEAYQKIYDEYDSLSRGHFFPENLLPLIKYCPECGRQTKNSAVWDYECSDCGFPVTEDMVKCPHCGSTRAKKHV